MSRLANCLLVLASLATPLSHAGPLADFNGDGRSDILWRHQGTGGTGENYLYPMNGTGILPSEGYLRRVADRNWQIAAIGDFNANGQSDILWRNPTTGEMDGWVLKGGQWAGSMTFNPLDPGYQVAGAGDFNGDGAADVLWRNPSTGHTTEWILASTAPTHASDYLVV